MYLDLQVKLPEFPHQSQLTFFRSVLCAGAFQDPVTKEQQAYNEFIESICSELADLGDINKNDGRGEKDGNK